MLSDRPGKLVAEDAAAAGVPAGTALNFRRGTTKRIRVSSFNALVTLEPYSELDPIVPERVDVLLEAHQFLLSRPEYQPWFRRWSVHGGDKYLAARLGGLPPLDSADERSEELVASFTPEMRLEFEAYLNLCRERLAREQIPTEITPEAVRQALSRARRGA